TKKVTEKYSILSDSFIYKYQFKPNIFSNYGLGEFVYKRTYSRIKDDGNCEEWFETIGRVINGLFRIKKKHYDENKIDWDNEKETKFAEKMYDLMFNAKFLCGGRGLWAMGSRITDEKYIYAAVSSCAGIDTNNPDDPSQPFEFLFDACMLGVGVGFTAKTTNIKLYMPKDEIKKHIIADSREGWVQALRELLRSYFIENSCTIEFDYSKIRPAGQLLKVFGGTSSGPEPLKKSFDQIKNLIVNNIKAGKNILDSRLIVDIMNVMCVCVISGNVRRSATLSLGNLEDEEFINLKDYDINPERASYGWMSNNSIDAKIGMNYKQIELSNCKLGEPGLLWMSNARKYSRMGVHAIEDNKDEKAVLTNPCGEITLHNGELCNLVEVFINRHESLEDFLNTLKYAFTYGKIVSLTKTFWEVTNKVIEKNRRVGVSLTGIANFIEDHGIEALHQWCEKGYDFIKNYDKELSKELMINESIKVTTCKPSGSISLLVPNTTPGIHYPLSKYYIRRVRINVNKKNLIESMRSKGYNIVKSETEPNTLIVEFPIYSGCKRDATEMTMWEQFEITAKLQEWWSDNQVSCTIYFDPDREAHDIAHCLDLYQYRLKGISFLPVYKNFVNVEKKIQKYIQPPYEEITKEE
ncbi:MAG: fused protease/ribonucleoside-triphosphate reductase, partial [Bacilli bacterium]|nr:fused protease/ribonucleoside-triphosphate reductase [Bacilli bacterium]